MPIIPNVDLYRGYMIFNGLGVHVVYANLKAAQILKNANNDRVCFDILIANTESRRGYYTEHSLM